MTTTTASCTENTLQAAAVRAARSHPENKNTSNLKLDPAAVERNRADLWKTGLRLLPASLLVLIFGLIYEHFGHGVFSAFMAFAWVIPLAGGAIPCLLMAARRRFRAPLAATRQLWLSGVTALTVGSLFRGVLDIYGTTNRLILFYPILGFGLVCAGILTYFIRDRKQY